MAKRSTRSASRSWPRRPTPIGLARSFYRAVSKLSCRASGVCAEIAFRRPPRFRATRRETGLLTLGSPSFVRGPLGEIAIWQWGDGPRVLLAHGWGAHAGRLTPFVAGLLDAGFGVAAFDAPGHGASPGRFASLPEFVDALVRVARSVYPVALVGHSLGAAACALALHHGTPSRAAVLLAPPADPGDFTRRYARWMRLTPAAVVAMRRRLEHRYGSLDAYNLVARSPGVPTLIIHDRGDVRVPFADGRALARSWPGARLVETRGLGHHRILKDAAVVRRAVRFLADTALAPAAAPRLAAPGRLAVRHAS